VAGTQFCQVNAYSSVLQGTWAAAPDATQHLCFIFQNSSAAQNDGLRFKIWLPVGTYTFRLTAKTEPGSGILDVQFNAASKGTIDLYSATLTVNVISNIASIAIATSGLVNIDLILSTKNGSSSGYGATLTSFSLVRTA